MKLDGIAAGEGFLMGHDSNLSMKFPGDWMVRWHPLKAFVKLKK
jgi:hypothetical protein